MPRAIPRRRHAHLRHHRRQHRRRLHHRREHRRDHRGQLHAAGLRDHPDFTLTVEVTDAGSSATPPGHDQPHQRQRGPGRQHQSFSLAENSATGTAVGTVPRATPSGDTRTYAITAGNTGGAFTIDANTGVITVASTAARLRGDPDFTLTVAVTDAAASRHRPITINLTNVNEAPVVNDQASAWPRTAPPAPRWARWPRATPMRRHPHLRHHRGQHRRRLHDRRQHRRDHRRQQRAARL